MTEDNPNNLYAQAERHQDERRSWHGFAVVQNDAANKKQQAASARLFNVLVIRALIEFAILAALVVMLVRG